MLGKRGRGLTPHPCPTPRENYRVKVVETAPRGGSAWMRSATEMARIRTPPYGQNIGYAGRL